MSAARDGAPASDPQDLSAAAKEPTATVLRAPRPPITRYRPAVIGAALLAVLLLVGLGFLIAFGGGHKRPSTAAASPAPAEPATTATPIDERLPATYGELGPAPAPASLAAAPGAASPSQEAGVTTSSGASTGGDGGARQRQLEDQRAAQGSAPFFGGAAGSTAQAAAAPSLPPLAFAGPEAAPTPAAGLSAKEGFIARASAPQANYAPGLPQPPLSPYEVKAGSVIAAALVTGLNSDLPGMVVAQVTQPVFDHATGRVMLIPQGARLIGKYDSQVGYGQDRVLLVWTRLIYPSGRSVDLGAMTGADVTGAGGLSDRTDTHLPVLARAIGLSTLISIGGAAAQNSVARGSDNLVLQDGAGGIASQASQTGQRLVERDLQRNPTLRIRPGFPVRVMVDKDLILPPEGALQ
uniref:Conjugation TrbI family protein n=1 Tax=Caulobacter sp. (strain K31) TaxID=366602 RepID=B0T9F9_CAUSK